MYKFAKYYKMVQKLNITKTAELFKATKFNFKKIQPKNDIFTLLFSVSILLHSFLAFFTVEYNEIANC